MSHTYAGQLIEAGESYSLQSYQERTAFSADAKLNQDIWATTALAVVNDGSTDLSPQEGDAWLKANSIAPVDTDGAPLTRTKITQSGWHFQLHAIEFITSKLSSVYNSNDSEVDLGFTTIKYYNSAGAELVAGTQAELDSDCVKTVIDWEANHDIEVIGGFFEQASQPTTDVRLWIEAIPDLPIIYGGSVPFVQGGLNLRLLSGKIDIDGKTPKMLSYDAVNHTNKFRITLTHDAGVQHDSMILFKIFRLNA